MRGLGGGCQVPIGDCCGGCDFRTDDEKRADYEEERAMYGEEPVVGALPRPATPGPWKYGNNAVSDHPIYTELSPADDFAFVIKEPDAAAIAALPERIAREDRVREVCERTVSSKLDTSEARVEAALARDILRILDGEEGA